MCSVAIGESGDAYPELKEKADYIKKVLSLEEERFDTTIDQGLSILDTLIKDARAKGASVIDGADAFKLYDTFGFPIDLTREIAEENGLTIDEDTFKALMAEQRQRAREARANIGGWDNKDSALDLPKTSFVGYAQTEAQGKVLAIINENGESIDKIDEGECSIVLDTTAFYGEGGGQVGDTGSLENENCTIAVTDTKKHDGVFVHLCVLEGGSVKVGDTLVGKIDTARRQAIARNHSSVHLLQAALREVLGSHVEQSGSYVDDKIGRFDFTHFSALTKEEIARVEAIVNMHILNGEAVNTVETDIDTARASGAMALFGEKYGKVVRMVKMGEFSTELCGGTHLDNTAKAGMFKIISESSVAAGVRRIEATTGYGVLELLAGKEALIRDTARELKCQNENDIAKRALGVQDEVKALKREIESLNSKMANSRVSDLISGAKSVNGISVITADLGDMSVDAVRSLGDSIKDKNPSAVAVFAIHSGERLNFIAVCGKDAVAKGAHAGNILREVSALTGGKGGGRPDSAMSGGRDISKIAEALALVEALVQNK